MRSGPPSGQLPIGQTFDWISDEKSHTGFIKGALRKIGERHYIEDTGEEYEVGELWAVAYHVGRNFQPPDETKMPTKADLDGFLPRGTVWHKEFALPANPTKEAISFSRLSRRKKFLALIALTYPANTKYPSILKASYGSTVPKYAWDILNRFVKRGTPVSQFLKNDHITATTRAVILVARDAGRCKDEFMTVFAFSGISGSFACDHAIRLIETENPLG